MAGDPEKRGSIIFFEKDQSGSVTAEYRQEDSNIVRVQHALNDKSVQPRATSHLQGLINIFLPAGYPKSVTEDYLEYQIYVGENARWWSHDTRLAVIPSGSASVLTDITDVIWATLVRFVTRYDWTCHLNDTAVGFEDSGASTTAAILLNILQDSIGRIATILFAHRLGSSLEPECKRFRFAADIFNDSALIFDCLSPIFPKAVRVMLLCTAGTLRALCGVAGGGSKAQLSVHFAKWGNVAELNAKDSSQETVISLMGMLAGSLVISSVTSKLATWVTMLSLIAIHLWTNYRAVKSVTMVTLNRQRANLVMSTFSDTGVILSPKDVAKRERIFERDGVLRWHDGSVVGWGMIGTRLSTIIAPLSSKDEKVTPGDVAKACQNEPYMLWTRHRLQSPEVYICLQSGCTPAGQLKAWMHGLLSARALSDRRTQADGDSEAALRALIDAKRQIDSSFDEFLKRLADAGWDTGDPQLETSTAYRYEMAM